MTEFQVKKAKKTREQLNLPVMSFVVADDWIDKLGEKSFCFWLKLHTMVDRKGDFEKVPTSQGKLAKRYEMAKSTLYRYLKPLYEYGLIDYVEYQEYTKEGNKPENIVVYEYPLHDDERQKKPLEKLRNWEDRIAIKFDFTKKGGRPKTEEKSDAMIIKDSKLHVGLKHILTHYLEPFRANTVDIELLVEFLEKKEKTIAKDDLLLLLEQLADYHEPIQKTLSFINSTLDKAPAIREAKEKAQIGKDIDKWMEEKDKELAEDRKVVQFYNWLES